MPSSRRKNNHVTRFQGKRSPPVASKLDLAGSASDTEDLVYPRVVVSVVVYAVSPTVGPARR